MRIYTKVAPPEVTDWASILTTLKTVAPGMGGSIIFTTVTGSTVELSSAEWTQLLAYAEAGRRGTP